MISVNSNGHTICQGKRDKKDFIFGKEDVLHFKYDPFYKILEIKKQNGKKLTFSSYGIPGKVYAFVRLTYASDSVQLV